MFFFAPVGRRRRCVHMKTRRLVLLSLAAAPLLARDAAAAVCRATADNVEGPFFKAGAPRRSRLVEAGAPGVPLSLSGSVVGPDCKPLRDVRMQLWQADPHGAYDNTGDRFRARLTLGDGRFHVDSRVPGRYLNGREYRPAHIHIKLAARGFAPLTTQLYFPGDPYNTRDPWFKPELLMRTEQTRAGGLDATFRFALAK